MRTLSPIQKSLDILDVSRLIKVQSNYKKMQNSQKSSKSGSKPRLLAIDYGKKRWGFAYCDELRLVFTLPAATQVNFNERLATLKALIIERGINHLIIGLPLTLDGGKSELTLEVERFIEGALKPLGLPVSTIDEGLSSFEAEASIPKQKIKKGLQKRDGTVDSKAAAIILEEYIAQHPENE